MSEWRAEPSFLKWQFLEKLAGNQISRIVGIIPVAGYLILFNDGLVEVTSFNQIAGVSNEAETTFLLSGLTKLRLTFFGSILVLLANLLFLWSSPKVLGQSKGDFEFADRVVASYSVREIRQIEEDIFKDDWVFRTPLVSEDETPSTNLRMKNRSQEPRLQGFRDKRQILRDFDEYVRACSREWWEGQMHSKWCLRRAVLASSILGYTMLIIPTIDIAQAVFRDFTL